MTKTFKLFWDDNGPYDMKREGKDKKGNPVWKGSVEIARRRCCYCRGRSGELVGYGPTWCHAKCRIAAAAARERKQQQAGIVGRTIKFADNFCPGCGSSLALITASLVLECSRCGNSRGRLKQSTADRLLEVTRMFGAPEVITVRLPRDVECVTETETASTERKTQ